MEREPEEDEEQGAQNKEHVDQQQDEYLVQECQEGEHLGFESNLINRVSFRILLFVFQDEFFQNRVLFL